MTSKEEEKEIELLEKKIRYGSEDIEEYAKLKKLYFDRGKYDDLLTLLNLIIVKSNLTGLNLASVYFDRGVILQVFNRNEEAIVSFQQSLQILQKIDDSGDALYLKAMNHYHLVSLSDNERYQHAQEAIDYLTLTIKHPLEYDDKYESYSCLGEMYALLEDYENALSFYNGALELASNTQDVVSALVEIASTYGKRQEFDKAIHYLEEALQKGGDTIPVTEIYYELGKIYFEAEQFAKAGQAFRNALNCLRNDSKLKANPEYEIDISWHLGSIVYEEHNFERAIQYLTNVLRKIGDEHNYYADSHLTLGHCYLLLEEYQRALEHYNYVLTASRVSDEQITMARECIKRIPLEKYHVH